MSTDHVHHSHPEIIKRLKRAEGHLGRVIAMIEEGRSCLDLAQQLHAVEKAVAQAKKTLIHDHVDNSLDVAATGASWKPTKNRLAESKAISRYLGAGAGRWFLEDLHGCWVSPSLLRRARSRFGGRECRSCARRWAWHRRSRRKNPGR